MQIAGLKIRPFVVTVREMPERTEFIQNHFKSFGVEAENFSGINGSIAGVRTEHTYEVDNPGSGWRIGHKEVATWLSFYMMWSAMIYMPEPYFWSLEWDCRFQTNWKARLESAILNTPKDFDMLFVGSCCCGAARRSHVMGEVWDVRYPVCGHSTIIAKKALPVLLETQRKIYAPLDLSLMYHSLPLLKVYTVLPRICDQFNTELPD
jgi:GR25 family glycosyltransferase involved in LPS biosynthesis